MTRTLTAMISIALIAALPVTAAKPQSTFSYGGVLASGNTIEFHTDPATNQIDRVTITGRAHVESLGTKDKAAQIAFSADASKITFQFFTQKPKAGTQGIELVKKGDFEGPVKMVYAVTTSGATAKTIATADSATFSGQDQMARLVGNVKITQDDPAQFHVPAVMSGDQATMNLNRVLAPDGFRFRIESSPGVSTLSVTPNAKTEAQQNQ